MELNNWKKFRDSQEEILIQAGSVAHIAVKIRYIDMGKAEKGTILLMHGIPTWGFLYWQIIPRLVENGYRVIAPDFLGHGWSDRRDRFDRSFQDQARMIVALFEALKIESTDIVGHDTGGAVALILAIEHKKLVNRLVICNSVCYDRFDDDMLDFGHPLRWKPRSVSEVVDAIEQSLALGITNQKNLTKDFIDGITAPWADEEGKLSLLRNASALNANQTMALVDRHGDITAPTMIMWAVDDPWQKAEDGRRLASEIPNSIYKEIMDASHWVQQDAPKEFTNSLLEFLKST